MGKEKNAAIKEAAKAKGVKLWEIADRIGINDGNLSRRLRKELPTAERESMLRLIDEIATEKGVM